MTTHAKTMVGNAMAPPSRGPAAAVWAAYRAVEAIPPAEQACILTLPLLLLYVDDAWYVRVPAAACAIAGLIFPTLRRQPLFWTTIAAVLGAGLYANRFSADNHKYLLFYWCVALAVGFATCDAAVSFARSARWLLALTFALAAGWKLVNPDFLNGDFFHHALLFDPRFSLKLEVAGLISPQARALNDMALRAISAPDGGPVHVALVSTPAVRWLAVALTVWAFALETALAVSFALPRRWTGLLPHVLLLVFVVSTYSVAPVIGFGWVLAVMGFVACDASHRRVRLSYLAVLVVLQVFRLPWPSMVGVLSQ